MMSHQPYLSRMAFNLLAKQIDAKPMVTIDAHNYMWGYEDTLLTLGHTFMPSWIQFDTMGLLDRVSWNFNKNKEFFKNFQPLDASTVDYIIKEAEYYGELKFYLCHN